VGETHGLENERGEVRVRKRENDLRKGKRGGRERGRREGGREGGREGIYMDPAEGEGNGFVAYHGSPRTRGGGRPLA